MTLQKTKNLIILFAIGILTLTSWDAKSQTFKESTCGTDQVMESLYKKVPKARTELHQLRNKSRLLHSRGTRIANSYIIPVVFHVFGTEFNNGSTVDLNVVKEALKLTNEDFQGLNADYTTIDAPFDIIKKPLDITFKLAQLDPEGNPTTGVIFHDKASGMGEYNSPDVKRVAWDNYKYCNIYITRDLYANGDFYNSGVAWYPNKTMSDENIARVVYNGSFLGKNTNENFRSVLTHEFGHYLDLPHTFDKGVCNNDPNDGDGVADTPSQKNNSSRTQCKVLKNCLNQEINSENFMDYTDCYKMFTKGQVDRMTNALENSVTRNTLWTPSNLIATGLSGDLGTRIVTSSNTFEERYLNDGIIEKTITLNCVDCTYTKTSGNFTLGSDYTIANLPTGITPRLELKNNTTAVLHLEGKATNHDAINSVPNLTMNFLNSMVNGGISNLRNKNLKLKINFKNVYTEYCNINLRFGTYTHISKVDFNGTTNETAENGVSNYISKIKFKSKKGKTYPLTITTNKGNGGTADKLRIQAWFDWNKDFVYSDNELVITHAYSNSQTDGNGNYNYTTNITIPSSTTIGNTAFRVLAHYVQGTEGDTACSSIDSGESEDYGLTILEENAPFSVDFFGSPTDVNFSQKVNFSDASVPDNGDTITQWKWTFAGGVPSTSTSRNPKNIIFPEAGKYDVNIEVTTANGNKKSLTKTEYITSKLSYCESNPSFGTYFNVNKITLADINHAPRGSSSNSYYNTVSTELKAGDTYPITIKSEKGNGGSGDVNRVRVWADWNFDSQFSKNELLLSKEVKSSDYNSNNEFEFTDNIIVPANAAIGRKVALRIIGHFVDGKGGETACGKYDSGNTTDYGIIITNGTGIILPKITSISNVTAIEGNNLEHTVTLNKISDKEESHPLTITDNTATGNGVDYNNATFNNGVTYDGINIKVPANVLNFTITISTIDDSIKESNETYRITSKSINATGTITDNDVDTNPDNYCAASTVRDDSYITKVAFGSVNNTSEHQAYSNYSTISDTFNLGDTFTLTIKTKNDHWIYNAIGAWIDWNNDGNFNDSERVFKNYGAGPYTTDINIPSNAITDKPLRMRIRKAYGAVSKIVPCGEDTYFGEVEDYSIIINSPPTNYCTASTIRDDSYITNVTFGTVTNTSEHQAYSDYSNISATFSLKDSFTLSIETKRDYWTYNAIGAWIDWNNDGVFSDSENVFKAFRAGPYNTNITVPSNAITNKPLRMRVRKGYGAESKIVSCGEDTYFGEVEDYSIIISNSNTTSINDAEIITIFPVPTKESLHFITPSNANINISIMNIQGEVVLKTIKTPKQNKTMLSLINLPHGVYFIQGKQKNIILNEKIIISK